MNDKRQFITQQNKRTDELLAQLSQLRNVHRTQAASVLGH